MSKKDYQKLLVQDFITMLEQGLSQDTWDAPWHRVQLQFPINAFTNQPYQGGNIFNLMMMQLNRGYSSNKWGTYIQWTKLGYKMDGLSAKAYNQYAIRPKQRYKTEVNDDGVEEKIPYNVFDAYAVFNEDQVKRVQLNPPKIIPEDEMKSYLKKQTVDYFVRQVQHDYKIPIEHEGIAGAYYNLKTKAITIPERQHFRSDIHYLSTLWHETGHATGSKDRCNRNLNANKHTKEYAYEELVAELFACFKSAQESIPMIARQDHAQYLNSWLKGLKAKPQMLWDVCKDASLALNYCNNLSKNLVKKVA